MATDALTPVLPAPAQTVFARLSRGRIELRPWCAFTFDQADAVYQADGTTPEVNSVGQPFLRGRNQLTTLWTDEPAKLGDLESRVTVYVRGGKSTDDAEATVAYEELAAARSAGTLEAIRALGYEVHGTFIPWP